MRECPLHPGQGQLHRQCSVLLWEGIPRIPELRCWLSPRPGDSNSSRPQVTQDAPNPWPSAGGAGPLEMRFSEVCWQPPPSPYASVVLLENWVEGRGDMTVWPGYDWQGGCQMLAELWTACSCPQMAGLAAPQEYSSSGQPGLC